MILSPADLVTLTGYQQPARQVRWLRDRLRLDPPLRADGSPVVSQAQIERALAEPKSGAGAGSAGPRWSKVPA